MELLKVSNKKKKGKRGRRGEGLSSLHGPHRRAGDQSQTELRSAKAGLGSGAGASHMISDPILQDHVHVFFMGFSESHAALRIGEHVRLQIHGGPIHALPGRAGDWWEIHALPRFAQIRRHRRQRRKVWRAWQPGRRPQVPPITAAARLHPRYSGSCSLLWGRLRYDLGIHHY